MAGAVIQRLLLHRGFGVTRRAFGTSTAEHHHGEATPCLYSVLGVRADAPHCEIRQAFLGKAKALHPDVRQQNSTNTGEQMNIQRREAHSADPSSFLELMSAYEVLRSPSRRHRYDHLRQHPPGASAAAGGGGGQRRGWGSAAPGGFAASADPRGQQTHAQQDAMDAAEAEADRWLLWLYHVIGGRQSPQGALIKHNAGPLRSALLEAYLGPWVDISQGFPSCFEAEERNAGLTGVNDILHVVSGRQLLGTIRIPLPQGLEGGAADKAARLEAAAPSREELPRQPLSTEESHAEGESYQGEGNTKEGVRPCSSSPSHHPHQQPQQHQHRQQQNQQQQSERRRQHPADTPLELTVAGDVAARAVRSPAGADAKLVLPRHCGAAAGPEAFPPVGRTADGRLDRDLISVWMKPEHSADEKAGVEMELVAHIEGLRRPGPLGRKFRSARVFDAEGKQTHTIVAHRTVGVRSLTWTQGKYGWVECRCQRAWLPPSEYWMFQPRVETHSSGGWYFERYTHDCQYTTSRQRHSMSPVLPAPCHILVAAYESLDEEQESLKRVALQQSDRGTRSGEASGATAAADAAAGLSGRWSAMISSLWNSSVPSNERKN